MEFFYPNFINDFWRIMGLLFFHDKEHEPTDIASLLLEMPDCHRIVTTGGKASEELLNQINLQLSEPIHEIPSVGTCCTFYAWNRSMEWWRMPSTSRAYPMSLDKKAEHYAKLL